ncbi:MAG: VTT domain-containing protein [Terriglobales bacterium]
MSLMTSYAVVFAASLAENIGLPLPAWPIIVLGAAAAAHGRGSVLLVLLAATLAALGADYAWFLFGRKRGRKVLRLLCAISLNPDSCVRKTEDTFYRHGLKSLLVAKFVPGLNTVAPPMAGMLKHSSSRFLLFDSAGTLVWAGSAVAVGFLWQRQVEVVLERFSQFGHGAVAGVVGAFVAFALWKYYERRLYYGKLRAARVQPHEVHEMLNQGRELAIVDLRSSAAIQRDPQKLPGALLIPPEEFEQHWERIPRDREVILYCT